MKSEAVSQVVFEAFLGGPTALTTMDLIVNQKKLDGKPVIQLETAAGSAIKCFQNPQALVVPRSRFIPVKNTNDLFLVRSNLYVLEGWRISFNPLRQLDVLPRVRFGHRFQSVEDFLLRVPSNIDVIDLDHLTVSGDVWFGNHVVLRGAVIIIAELGERIDIPDHTVLENKIVTGHIRVLDH
jgi:UTP--glucose-1-phosphate uridylyltransferase